MTLFFKIVPQLHSLNSRAQLNDSLALNYLKELMPPYSLYLQA
jgi:hypothetical protein